MQTVEVPDDFVVSIKMSVPSYNLLVGVLAKQTNESHTYPLFVDIQQQLQQQIQQQPQRNGDLTNAIPRLKDTDVDITSVVEGQNKTD